MLQLFDRLNLTPSERRLVVIIATVAVLVLNYWLVWPRFKDFGEIQEDLKTMQRRLTIFEAEIGRRPVYELALSNLQEDGSALPAGEERIQFLTDMQRLARDVGLLVPRWGEVLSERGGTATNASAFFEAIGLTMNQVSGTEAQFVDFLYRVGASNSTIRVKELTLVPGNYDARAQGKTNLIATIKLVASVQKAQAKPESTPGSTAVVAPAPGATKAPAVVAAPAGAPTPALGGTARAGDTPSGPSAGVGVPGTGSGPSRLRSGPAGMRAATNLLAVPVRAVPRTNAPGAGVAPRY